MFKLLALDLDGTLLNSTNQISPVDLQAVRAAYSAGIQVVLTSGRSYQAIYAFADQIGLRESIVIALAGADIKEHPSKAVLRSLVFSKKQFNKARNFALQNKLYYQIFRTTGEYYFEQETEESKHYAEQNGFCGHTTDMENWNCCDTCKVMLVTDENNTSVIYEKALQELHEDLDVVKSMSRTIDIYPHGCNKGTALAWVTNRLDISPDQIVAIGDEMVDYSMLAYAGFGIAMGNANEKLKKAANAITLDNDSHGVAYAIQKYIL